GLCAARLLVGRFRTRLGRGGPGFGVPPDRIVEEGPARYVRNPMYLGHLIFMLGPALTFASWFALILFVARAVWFHRRVLEDEAHLQEMFGASYLDYQRRGEGRVSGLFCTGVPGVRPCCSTIAKRYVVPRR